MIDGMENLDRLTVIELQGRLIRNLEEMVEIQKEAIRDRDELIALQNRVIELDERLNELRERISLYASPVGLAEGDPNGQD